MVRKFAVVILLVGMFFVGLSITQNADSSEAKGDPPNTTVKAKLDEVITNQQQIIAKLDEIKSELQIVKIRASRR